MMLLIKENMETGEQHVGRQEFDPIGSYTICSEKGERDYQEDRCVVKTLQLGDLRLQMLAIMDGHSGSDVAELVKNILPKIVEESFLQTGTDIPRLLQDTINTINQHTRYNHSGSTLSMVIIPNDERKAYVAVLGDSPVIILDQNGRAVTSPDHNIRTNLEERNEAIKKGAITDGRYIYDQKTGNGIQMSRALGDVSMDSILNRNPEIYEVNISEDSFVVVATDGVLDPGHDTELDIYRVIEMVDKGAEAENLVKDALERQTGDNATAIVWRARTGVR